MSTTIEDFMKTATEEQRELLFKLSETVEQEKKYVDEIDRIYKSIKSGVYSEDGLAVTVCENEDDVAIISMKPRQELEKVRGEMKEYMKKAVKIGMGQLGLIQRNYEFYVGDLYQHNSTYNVHIFAKV